MGLKSDRKKKKKSKKSLDNSSSTKRIPKDDAELIAQAYQDMHEYEEEKLTKKVKAKVKKKLSTEYSEALDEVSDIDFSEIGTNLDLLILLRSVLLSTLKTTRGSFNAKPTKGNAIVITRLVNDIQNISKLIESATDYNALIDGISSEVMKPFLERLLLELGQVIQETVEKYGKTEERRKKLKRYLTDMYRNYGSLVGTKTPQLEEQLKRYILDKV